MATANEEYAIKWNDHANNFSILFSNLLEQKDLIDVTLVADGYLFNAHRLVLSAISPYFRQMFTQMPVNQQAFVFLKDISKQVIEDLITFIYRGEICVNEKNLEEFFKTAKSLEINGLADQSYFQAYEPKSSASIGTSPVYSFNGSQYQSTRTVPVQSPANEQIDPDWVQSSHYHGQPTNGFQQQSPSISGSSFDPPESRFSDQPMSNNNDIDYSDDYLDMASNTRPMDQHTQDIQWNNFDVNEQLEAPKRFNAPKEKRVKRSNDDSEYNIVADIRKKVAGGENLFYNGYKYTKHNKTHSKQHWQCTKTKSASCHASASTKDIDGVIMMRVLISEHTHPSDQ